MEAASLPKSQCLLSQQVCSSTPSAATSYIDPPTSVHYQSSPSHFTHIPSPSNLHPSSQYAISPPLPLSLSWPLHWRGTITASLRCSTSMAKSLFSVKTNEWPIGGAEPHRIDNEMRQGRGDCFTLVWPLWLYRL